MTVDAHQKSPSRLQGIHSIARKATSRIGSLPALKGPGAVPGPSANMSSVLHKRSTSRTSALLPKRPAEHQTQPWKANKGSPPKFGNRAILAGSTSIPESSEEASSKYLIIPPSQHYNRQLRSMATIQPPLLGHCGPGHGSRSQLGIPPIRHAHESRDSKFVGEPNPAGFKAAFINRATSKTSLGKDASNRYLMEDARKRHSTQANRDLRHQLANAKAKLNANYDYVKARTRGHYSPPANKYGAKSAALSRSVLPKVALPGGPGTEAVPSQKDWDSRPDTALSSKLAGAIHEDGHTLY